MIGYDKQTGSRRTMPVTARFEEFLRSYRGDPSLARSEYVVKQRGWIQRNYAHGSQAVQCAEEAARNTDTRTEGWQVNPDQIRKCGKSAGIPDHEIGILQEYASMYAEENVVTLKARLFQELDPKD